MAKLIEIERYERKSIDRMGNHYDLNCRLMQNPKTGDKTEQILQVKHLGKGDDRFTNAIQAITEVVTKAYRLGIKPVTLDLIQQYHQKRKRPTYDSFSVVHYWLQINDSIDYPGEHSPYLDLRNWMADCI